MNYISSLFIIFGSLLIWLLIVLLILRWYNVISVKYEKKKREAKR